MNFKISTLLNVFLLTVLSAGVLSCTSLSKEECQTINWFEQGKVDGLRGRSSDRLAEFQKTCTKHSVPVDQASYQKGRTDGLKIFCTYDSGYKFGLDGNSYPGVCPQELELNFLKGYQLGKQSYDLKRREEEVERREEEIKRREEELRREENRKSIHRY